jgi:hypothetical protein
MKLAFADANYWHGITPKYRMNIKRMRRLAGLQEQVMNDDEMLHQDDEQRSREQQIEAHIAFAFRAIGLSIAEDGIFYQEDNDREAVVTLAENEADLSLLAKLQDTGLAKRYLIQGGESFQLVVTFSVAPELDAAVGRKNG